MYTHKYLSQVIVFVFDYGSFFWQSKKQHNVTLSKIEVEYMEVTQFVKEPLWLQKLMTKSKFPPNFFCLFFFFKWSIVTINLVLQFFKTLFFIYAITHWHETFCEGKNNKWKSYFNLLSYKSNGNKNILTKSLSQE